MKPVRCESSQAQVDSVAAALPSAGDSSGSAPPESYRVGGSLYLLPRPTVAEVLPSKGDGKGLLLSGAGSVPNPVCSRARSPFSI